MELHNNAQGDGFEYDGITNANAQRKLASKQ
jgi:hypothetical protein